MSGPSKVGGLQSPGNGDVPPGEGGGASPKSPKEGAAPAGAARNTLMTKEHRVEGAVSFNTFRKYFTVRAVKGPCVG